VSVTEAELTPFIAEATQRWAAAGFDVSVLSGVQFVVADLPGNLLGLTHLTTIWIDVNAAGHGWFLDPSLGDDSEFAAGNTTPSGVDLLTVVMHEEGHVLGFASIESSILDGSIMTLTLGAGQRRGPAGFLDAVNAQGTQAVDAALALVRSTYQDVVDHGVSAGDLPDMSTLTLQNATAIFGDLLSWEAWLNA